mmetsp:Transcript_67716/g.207493  ORF Transcript_67716/g.207493 Transcript_67716/m.207493 type:complete len:266 (+) Transcript_67716:1081-1878(+)
MLARCPVPRWRGQEDHSAGLLAHASAGAARRDGFAGRPCRHAESDQPGAPPAPASRGAAAEQRALAHDVPLQTRQAVGLGRGEEQALLRRRQMAPVVVELQFPEGQQRDHSRGDAGRPGERRRHVRPRGDPGRGGVLHNRHPRAVELRLGFVADRVRPAVCPLGVHADRPKLLHLDAVARCLRPVDHVADPHCARLLPDRPGGLGVQGVRVQDAGLRGPVRLVARVLEHLPVAVRLRPGDGSARWGLVPKFVDARRHQYDPFCFE